MTESDGFYLAFRDEGACIVLNRVVLSYNICPGGTADLVIRPETIAPRIGIPSQEVRVRAECVPGASLENQDSVEVLCLQRGEWAAVPEFGCRCDPELQASEGGFSCKSTLLVLRKCINVPPGRVYSLMTGIPQFLSIIQTQRPITLPLAVHAREG